MSIGDLLSGGGMGGLFRGLLINNAPKLVKGAMKQYLCQIPFITMVEWVNQNRNLWAELPEKYKNNLMEVGNQLGDLEWFTSDWLIECARETSPGIASLFLGWPEAREWLDKQIIDIKNNIKGE